EGAPRDVHGGGKRPLLVFVGLADVEHHRVAVGHLGGGLGRFHLADGRLGFGQHLPEGRHTGSNTTSGVNIPRPGGHRGGGGSDGRAGSGSDGAGPGGVGGGGGGREARR